MAIGDTIGSMFSPQPSQSSMTSTLVRLLTPLIPKIKEAKGIAPLSDEETAEVEAAASAEAERARRRRGLGAANTILTGPLGVTTADSGRVVRKTLLG